MKNACLLVMMTALSSCQGTLQVHPATVDEVDGNYEGIKFYPTTLMLDSYRTSVRIVSGNQVASSAGVPGTPEYCKPVLTTKLVIAADFSRPLIINYKHGLFESYVLSAALTDGMLISLSATSTPDQGKTFNNIVSPFTSALGALDFKAPADGTLACNDGPIFVSRAPVHCNEKECR